MVFKMLIFSNKQYFSLHIRVLMISFNYVVFFGILVEKRIQILELELCFLGKKRVDTHIRF